MQIEAAVSESFRIDLNALKPGNVSVHAPGHGMNAADFRRSAECSLPCLCRTGHTPGERMLEAVRATRAAVGCNTNLGMILLFAPLVCAAERLPAARLEAAALRRELARVLQEMDQYESHNVATAIREAKPGGLGHAGPQDIHTGTMTHVSAAMRLARARDRIALQFDTAFGDIFNDGLGELRYFINRWNSVEWGAVAYYLGCISRYPDSHIARRHGAVTAWELMRESLVYASRFRSACRPEQHRDELALFDQSLKNRGLNPGTSADLSAAGVLVYLLTHSGD